ncbi:glycosyltransferase family 39 protein [Amycolatopsis minnesotensis]|uniref:Glycosyltransferase family 39 protein n=1 Tax=Amycolatopsis minnesotensis TaxID=337894 RepID=A0ABN2RVF5_9PSEU
MLDSIFGPIERDVLATTASGAKATSHRALSALPALPVLATAGTVVTLALALSWRHGYYLDELYFRVAGKHLAWGYLDQPPLIPFLAKAQIALFGDTVAAIRVVPAIIGGLVVVLGALIARELGGGRRAQIVAAGATAASMLTISISHILHTFTVDLVVWQGICWCAIRLLRTRDTRLWLAIGAIVGAGLLNKLLLVLLVGVLAASLLLTGPREVLRSRHLAYGIGIAAVLAAPVLIWQTAHGWPQFDMASSMAGRDAVRIAFVPTLLLLLVGPVVCPLWIAGFVGLLRAPRWRAYRCFGAAFAIMVVLLLLLGAQARYTSGLLTVLLAAGSVTAADWAATATRRALTWLGVAANAALGIVVMLPVLPIGFYAQYAGFPLFGEGQVGQAGWPRLAEQVAAVHRTLPQQDAAHAVILTRTYSQAGAIDRYGPEYGLPGVYSGHNSYADFGVPGEDKTVVITFGMPAAQLASLFERCEPRGPLTADLPLLDRGQEIAVCHQPRESWSRLWPKIRWLGDF